MVKGLIKFNGLKKNLERKILFESSQIEFK